MQSHVITSRRRLARALTTKMVESEPATLMPSACLRIFDEITTAFFDSDDYDYFGLESHKLPKILTAFADPTAPKHSGNLAIVRFISGVHEQVMLIGEGYGALLTYPWFLSCAFAALDWPVTAVQQDSKLVGSRDFEKFAGFQFSVPSPR